MGSEELYTLTSVQAVPIRGGTAIRLMTNGPLAFGVLSDREVLPGMQRIRLRLYGVTAVADDALTPNGVAALTTAPDGRGNLDLTITASLALEPSRPFELRAGRGAQEVDVVLRSVF